MPPQQPAPPSLVPFFGPGITGPGAGADRPEDTIGGLLIDFLTVLFGTAQPPQVPDTDAGGLAIAPGGPNDPFMLTGQTSAFNFVQEQLMVAQERRKIHSEYENMEEDFPEISAALDIYADNVVSTDSMSDEVVSILTEDDTVGAVWLVLKDLLRLDAPEYLWTRAREITRTGEVFDEVVFDLNLFPSRMKALPTEDMIRNEDEFGRLPLEEAYFQIDDSNRRIATFGSWQIIHFRLIRRPTDLYGTGLLFPVRKLAKKLELAEQALLITRLTRAHKRLVFDVPVDGMSPDERRKYINDVKREYRKRRIVNPRTLKLDLEHNPLAAEDDIFLGSTKEGKVVIQEISGDPSVGTLTDIEYWQNKLFSALKVPKAYLGLERDINAKATLTEQDVQFARTVHRIQMALQFGLRQLMDRALILLGMDPVQVDYTLAFPAISLIDELRNWEIENTKIQVATQYKDLLRASDRWLLINLLGYSANEADELIADQDELPPEVLPGEEPPPEGEETPPEEEEARRAELETLFEKAKGLYLIGKRKERREAAMLTSSNGHTSRAQLAENMQRYKRISAERFGFSRRV